MSFDLYVWHEPAPITADAARAKLDRRIDGDTGPFRPHPAVPLMYDAVLDRFPLRADRGGDDARTWDVWSVEPQRSASLLAFRFLWSCTDDVAPVVPSMAADHGLICYDAGLHVLDPNVPGYVPGFTLTTAALLRPVPDPTAEHLEWSVRELTRDDDFVVLDRSGQWYVQAACTEDSSDYLLEYREGSPDRHYQSRTRSSADVLRLLTDFVAGDESWKRRHVWERLILDPRP